MKKVLSIFIIVCGIALAGMQDANAYRAWGEKKMIFWCDLESPDNSCSREIEQ